MSTVTRRAIAAVLAASCLGMAGCGGGAEKRQDAAAKGQGDNQVATYRNPVYPENFPDPQAIHAGDGFVVYATNGPLGNLPAMRSTDLAHWKVIGDAMPELASWARPGKTWAPEVLPLAEDRFVLYYTADSVKHGRQCIGRAVASSPEGPFRDESTHPLVCQADEGGSIDASPFRDADGTLFLYWKNDGNAVGSDTWIWVQRLAPDGLTLQGAPKQLFKQDAPWEAHLVEAPFMWRHDGRYYLFYSANAYDSDAYAAGYAVCESPTGPCRKAAENPILSSKGKAAGPGHLSLIEHAGRTWMLYHAWMSDAVGSVVPGRPMWLDEVVWKGGRPVVRGPTDTRQPLP